ncbi:hypothetical protein [Streptomyces sp. CBMA156]|uniref:hypothetical protein n=1 Tax=Streptomyces sp. CBMA156 TaxID=1930280 RepID=UPI00166191DF|nr:hypothetical protein [Streptomyces sp. CBMA156]MBD0673999.1 hypothetical protein [Streptomyces sp. CBMA156]
MSDPQVSDEIIAIAMTRLTHDLTPLADAVGLTFREYRTSLHPEVWKAYVHGYITAAFAGGQDEDLATAGSQIAVGVLAASEDPMVAALGAELLDIIFAPDDDPDREATPESPRTIEPADLPVLGYAHHAEHYHGQRGAGLWTSPAVDRVPDGTVLTTE